jgi:hypothetical protein
MIRKCAQIAEDMSRSEEEMGGQPSLPPVNKQTVDIQPATNINQVVQSSSSSSSSSTTHHHSMAEEYGAEAALIIENKERRDATVRNKSLALGIFSFVALRSGRGLTSWMRRAIATRASRPYQFDGMASKDIHSSASSTITTAAAAGQLNQPSKLRRFFRLTFDITLSTSITLFSGTFLFMPKPSAYIEDMSKLPLVEGKSVYAEMVCPPLLKEYRRVLEQYGGHWPVMMGSKRKQENNNEGQMTQEDVSLNIIRTFVENCSKRSKYERALVEERNALNLQSNEQQSSSAVSRLMRRLTQRSKMDNEVDNNKLGTVSIPSPGVPENITVDVDQDVYALATDDELNEEADEERSS